MNDIPRNTEKLIDDNEAEKRFEKFKSKDPFPNIHPALLNSADIHDYILATGMLCPYEPEKKLKSASYEIHFSEGEIVYWDEELKQRTHIFRDKEDTFVLRKNSIVYVSLKTKFRLPDYIALRFNLRINLVHKGLLLGTGPLVDPGFEGTLLIPLHNLTANDYKVKGGEGLIWVEFTKISDNVLWKNVDTLPRKGIYIRFPDDKRNRPREYYFNEALKDATPFDYIRSSIPGEVKKAIDIAKKADKSVSRLKISGWISIVSIVIALILALIPVVQLVLNSVNYVKGAREEVKQELQKLKELENKVQNYIANNDVKAHKKDTSTSPIAKDAKSKETDVKPGQEHVNK